MISFDRKSTHLALLGLLFCVTVDAQIPNSIQRSTRRRANIDREQAASNETAARLAEAEKRAAAEKARLSRESVIQADLPAKAATALRLGPDLSTPDERALEARSEAGMKSAIENLSEEGKALLNQPVQTRRPESEGVISMAQISDSPSITAQPDPTPQAPSPGAPKPQPLKPTPLQDPVEMARKTVITCTGASFFDANKAIGIFTENVRVYHPQFYIECDELEIFMKKEEKSDVTVPANDTQPPDPSSVLIQSSARSEKGEEGETGEEGQTGEEESEFGGESSIDKVIARGAMVTIEKFTEEGDIQVGKCKQATYDGTSGIITLRIWPQVQRGRRLQIASESGTVMTLSPEGAFKSVGRSTTELLPEEQGLQDRKSLRRPPMPGQ